MGQDSDLPIAIFSNLFPKATIYKKVNFTEYARPGMGILIIPLPRSSRQPGLLAGPGFERGRNGSNVGSSVWRALSHLVPPRVHFRPDH